MRVLVTVGSKFTPVKKILIYCHTLLTTQERCPKTLEPSRIKVEPSSIAILKSALLADMGATILPMSPLLAEIERGEMRAIPISGVPLSRTVVLCSSKNIPLTNAAMAVEKLVLDLSQALCESGKWQGTTSLV